MPSEYFGKSLRLAGLAPNTSCRLGAVGRDGLSASKMWQLLHWLETILPACASGGSEHSAAEAAPAVNAMAARPATRCFNDMGANSNPMGFLVARHYQPG